MKLNWAERIAVNNPLRDLVLKWEVNWLGGRGALGKGAAVMEVGCGRGSGASFISRYFDPSVLTLVDLDTQMVKSAKARLKRLADLRPCMFVVADASELPFGGGSVDALFAFGVLHHVEDWRGALREIHRVIREGGVYCFEEIFPPLYQNPITKRILLHPRQDRFDGPQLMLAMSQVGFRILDMAQLRGIGMLGVCQRVASSITSQRER